MFQLGQSVTYMILPTPEAKIKGLGLVNVLALTGSGAERELSSSVEVEMIVTKNEVVLACSSLLGYVLKAL